jgi:molecular chaperone GrpE
MSAKNKENKKEEIENEPMKGEKGTESAIEEKENNSETEVEETPIEEVDEETKLRSEISELKDKYLRLYSEFENFRRRTAKEKLELIDTANKELMYSLLPVVDDFERAGNSDLEKSDFKTYKEGMELIVNKFQNTLQQKGLVSMNTSPGAKFDAELHDAVTQIPAPKKKLKGKIVDTIEKGYLIGDKVIRHAKIVVGN